MPEVETSSPEIYTPKYYQRIAELENRHWWHLGMQHIALALLKTAGAGPIKRVLDAGCGTGAMMRWAGEKLGATDIHGIDISPDALAYCRAENPAWKVQEGSVLDLPFPPDMFDLVISNDVVQHLPTNGGDLQGIREMARVLVPGGALLLRTNSRLGMWQKTDARDHDYQRFIEEEVTQLLVAAGLTPVRATYANVIGSLHESARRLLRGRSDHKHTPGHSHDHDHAHPHSDEDQGPQRTVYEGLKIRDTAAVRPMANSLLLSALKTEAAYLARPRRRIGFGHALVVVAVKAKA
ncbi:MAG: class I SAM-dependent methyltransferase [Alphaproteobacteria bacterium]|nr:class I SAM-dependent methyltransferase [Alphaproteobacteria bacterium]